MKLKSTCALTIAGVLGMAQGANAGTVIDIYGGTVVGMGGQTIHVENGDFSKDKNYSTQTFGAVFGVDIPLLRAEAEYNYINADNLSMNLAAVNGYVKMPTPLIKPYIGAGVGIVFNADDKKLNTDIDSTAAYQAMLGATLDLPILPVKFDAELRGLYIPNIVDMHGISADVYNYDVRVKLRYVF
ncbi:MAG: hypothetical protein MJ187_03065 [Alphaproteobacteria bacterium]|nr:hypothetical protein [Alphaproteobacteria bacterium]